ncbi:unnamed protein product [Brugia timori]|uniref:7TM_GPCR_Srx domain-containing protein n=1 Tax=Brugia timori TaxID=42155 RepID=A0A0R3QAP3_9BILA|nr:unnamed protein product [Brugia timori]
MAGGSVIVLCHLRQPIICSLIAPFSFYNLVLFYCGP